MSSPPGSVWELVVSREGLGFESGGGMGNALSSSQSMGSADGARGATFEAFGNIDRRIYRIHPSSAPTLSHSAKHLCQAPSLVNSDWPRC
jgi:hypothetical protein